MLATNSASMCSESTSYSRTWCGMPRLSSWRTALVFMLLEIIVQQAPGGRQGSAGQARHRGGYRRYFFAKPVESDVGSGFHPAAGLLAGALRSVAKRRAEGDAIMVSKQDIGPAGTFQDAVRGSALTFDVPADPKRHR